ncbi:S26 family signal peptidase [Halobacteria archaeon AArc-dxtr1]|nr:S26 family signal peptidase [Halobacteria archaeon AArc-dxtr1]
MGAPGPDDDERDPEPHVPPSRASDSSDDEVTEGPDNEVTDERTTDGKSERLPDDARRTTTSDRQPSADRSGPETNGRSQGERGPASSGRARPSDDRVTIEDDGVLRWFFRSEEGTVVVVRDVLTSVAIVAVIGLVLFGISGVWPPLVAIESGSMEPNMHRGDMVFVADEERFVGDEPAAGTGIVPLADANDHNQFGKDGDVVIFRPGGDGNPVIHRAHYWVEEGDNWIDEQANPDYLGDATCDQVTTCPAPYDGFVTKGDANRGYDQVGFGTDSGIVRPEWVTGKAMVRVPYLGYVRLMFDELLLTGSVFGGIGESLLEQDRLWNGATEPFLGGEAVHVVGSGIASVGTASVAGATTVAVGQRG